MNRRCVYAKHREKIHAEREVCIVRSTNPVNQSADHTSFTSETSGLAMPSLQIEYKPRLIENNSHEQGSKGPCALVIDGVGQPACCIRCLSSS